MVTSVSGSDLPPPTLSFHGSLNDPQCFAQVDMTTGKLFMKDHTGGLVESYDWERFGKIAYQAVTGRKLPEGGGL